jgi:SAM-dependent methyltransferase
MCRGAAWKGPVRVAVDVGCGAGASTAALRGMAETIVGFDPYPPMVLAATRAVRDLGFAVAAAEAMPLAAGSVDLLAAAGSLDYVDVAAFVAEADRVLGAAGTIAVSNYGFGRPTDPAVVSGWADRFVRRWPRPPATPVTAGSFDRTPFRVVTDEKFVVTLPMAFDAYVAYLLTDTGVARAVAAGTTTTAVRAWCADQLAAFGAEQPVAFDCALLVLGR